MNEPSKHKQRIRQPHTGPPPPKLTQAASQPHVAGPGTFSGKAVMFTGMPAVWSSGLANVVCTCTGSRPLMNEAREGVQVKWLYCRCRTIPLLARAVRRGVLFSGKELLCQPTFAHLGEHPTRAKNMPHGCERAPGAG
jgi:hypothetical protein